jgi:uncharacterized protein (TIGR02271 family)
MESNTFAPQPGMTVIGSDGGKVGEIDAVEQDYFVIRKGMFFPTDHYIPFSAVDSYDDDALYLNVTKDGALEQQWNEQPLTTTGEYAVNDSDLGGTYGETRVDDVSYRETAGTDVDRNVGSYDDDTTIEVREETLGARTREVERGAVHVEKHVVEERQTLEVPVTEEEVHIERRAVDRPAGSIDLDEATYEIPLRGEEVELIREARVVEEIDIDKAARERTETVSGTVRREEVEINTDVNVDGTNRRGGNQSNDDDRGLLDRAKDAFNDDDENRRRF